MIPERANEECIFIMDVIIYNLYYDIVFDKTRYPNKDPKNPPYVNFPIEMIEYLIKRV